MIIKLDDHKFEIGGATATGQILYLSHRGAAELMESIARIQGFTLVDREERKELLGLVKEADEAKYENQELTALAALASAVSSALRFENDKEV